MAETLGKRVRLGCIELTRQECETMLTGIGSGFMTDDINLYTLQRIVFEAVMCGDLHPRDILGPDYKTFKPVELPVPLY